MMDIRDLQIRPAAGAHAIEVMALAVEYSTPLGVEDLERLASVYHASKELSEFLPVEESIGGIKIHVASEVGKRPTSQISTENQLGFTLKQQKGEESIAWSVTSLPQHISCSCMVYDRWQNIKSQALKLLTPFLDGAIQGERRIHVIGLQYQDAFVISGDVRSFRLTDLARHPNRWLSEAVFSHPSLWHAHQGWFSKAPENRRLLNILNIDMLDVGGTYRVRINGQHRLLSSSFEGEPLQHEFSALESAFDHMHSENKRLLSELLNDAILQQIGLRK